MRKSKINLSLQQVEQVKNLIKMAYADYYNATSHDAKYNILYGIIDMKIQSGDYKIYKDVKACLRNHVDSVDEKDYGYDIIEIEKVVAIASVLPIEQRMGVFKIFSRYLEEKNFLDEKDKVEQVMHGIRIEIASSDYLHKFNIVKYLLLLSTRSAINTVVSLILVILTELIFLLPTPIKSMQAVQFSPPSYCSSYFVNSFIGVLQMILDVNDEVKVVAITWNGAIAIILGKAFFIIIVANYLLKNLSEKNKF